MLGKVYRMVMPLWVREKLQLGNKLRKAIARIKITLPVHLKKKRSKIRFEIHITEHCNLNCKSCAHFSPIAEPEFIDVEEFRRDFQRMGEIFNHDCERINILGGEPLLHPELVTMIKIARKNFTSGIIVVFTNGILLPKIGNEFWQACHDNNIGVLISAYPIDIGTDKVKALAKKFGVSIEYEGGKKEHEFDTFIVYPVNLKGDGNAKLNFALCERANDCITLSHGRLFTCVFAPHVHHFSKYFKKSITITEDDSIDIYDDVNADDILRKLTEPLPACRYCDIIDHPRFIKWGISNRDISEWV